MGGAVPKRWRVSSDYYMLCAIHVLARLCRRAAYLYSTHVALACLRSMRGRSRQSRTGPKVYP